MDYLSLCLICKDENDYLPEWLDYHILMGVDRFYIYDNGSQFSLRETLKEYIERGWAVVVDIPGKAVQLYAYDHCLQTFGFCTFWLGFIDTDEFLVPKTTLDLKELLRKYEQYAGLAVSSLFFGSNGHQNRPIAGQIMSYTQRTHVTFKDNKLIKSIVQPRLTLFPYSPHEFTYKDNYWCVNEGFLRVDNQDFPNHTEKIQLNHYYCRSEQEIDQKLRRGNSGDIVWPYKRFEVINKLSTIQDTIILQKIEALFHMTEDGRNCVLDLPGSIDLLKKMAIMARLRPPTPLKFTQTADVTFRNEVATLIDVETQFLVVKERGDYKEIKEWILKKIEMFPQRFILYIDLAICYLNLIDPSNAWQILTQAWQFAPNSYSVMIGMVYYFLKEKNFEMAEKTCHLLLEIAPHDTTTLGFLALSMVGQERSEEALKLGVPLLELDWQFSELPDGMGVFLAKKLADYLVEKRDYVGAVRLWEAGVKHQQGNVNVLLELNRVLQLAGDTTGARRVLNQARKLAPHDAALLGQLTQECEVVPVGDKRKQ